MKIIDNINGSHYASIHTMLSSADNMLLVSPFLTEEFDEFINMVAERGIKNINLITTLKNNSTDLFKKVNALHSFCFSCVENKVNFEVRIDNRLHGKIYIAVKDGIPLKGIVTSANFTGNGLLQGHEWGIEIDDLGKLQSIMSDIYACCTEPLSNKEIESIVKTIDDYIQENPPTKELKPVLDVTKHIEHKLIPNITRNSETQDNEFPEGTRYFIKPLGATETPFEPTRKIGTDTLEIQFSNRRPNQVRPGDVLICYGVGVKKLLGYFQVISEPYRIEDEMQRWPWRVLTKNVCPQYSSNWWLHDNTLSSVIVSYGLEKPLTYVGGDSLGALSFGADKIRLDESFAHHLLDIIEKS